MKGAGRPAGNRPGDLSQGGDLDSMAARGRRTAREAGRGPFFNGKGKGTAPTSKSTVPRHEGKRRGDAATPIIKIADRRRKSKRANKISY